GGRKLDEPDRRLVMRDAERERRADLCVRRIEVETLVVGRLDVADSAGLEPERSPCQVVIERIPAVRRCTEDERNGVSETHCDADDQENQWPSARKGGPRPPEEVEGRGTCEEPDAAGGYEERHGSSDELAALQVPERRQEERQSDDRREGRDIRSEEGVRSAANAQGGGDQRTRGRQQANDEDSDTKTCHGGGVWHVQAIRPGARR